MKVLTLFTSHILPLLHSQLEICSTEVRSQIPSSYSVPLPWGTKFNKHISNSFNFKHRPISITWQTTLYQILSSHGG